MRQTSELAINECVRELRAACRRPIDQSALDTIVGWMRPQFAKILDRIDGPDRWAKMGDRLRENSRHLGAFADFFASHADVATVGIDELSHAVTMARADCTTRAERVPLGFEYCAGAPVDATAAEQFLRSVAPVPQLLRRAS